jgi:hypothetical protein
VAKRVELWAGYTEAALIGAAVMVILIAFLIYRVWG